MNTCNKRRYRKTHLTPSPKTLNLAIRQPKVNKILRVEVYWELIQWKIQPVEISNLFQRKLKSLWQVYFAANTLPRTARVEDLDVS